MTAMTEETFGPTLPIMKVADAEEAIRLANDSPFGLAASVWTKDAARGEEVARRVESGAVCVNDAQINYLALELPMGGWKTSGMGQRHGAPGIRKYCAPAVAAGDAARAQARPAHVPVQGAHDRACSCKGDQAAVRARQARLGRPAECSQSRSAWLVAVLGARRLLRRPPEPEARRARGAARLAGRRARAADPVRVRSSARSSRPTAAAGWAALAGAAGIVALGAFYRALAIGTMSVVAPISATAAAVPVLVGLAEGERPERAADRRHGDRAGGVILASREPSRGGRRDPPNRRRDRAGAGGGGGVRDVLRRPRPRRRATPTCSWVIVVSRSCSLRCSC